MTREEAIKIINCYDIGFYDLSGAKIPADKLADAFDMAIEALSTTNTENVSNYGTDDVRSRCEVDAKCDLISRTDAMGAVQDHFNADGFKGYDDGQQMMDRINALPSAEAVSRETYHNLVTASNDIDKALREYQDKEENGELVSVVRCKDCRHQKFYINDNESFHCDKSGVVNMHMEDGDGEFFCKYGERKEP